MPANRDPRKKSRTARNRSTSSSNRSVRSKASAKDTPKPTSSSTRSTTKGTSKKVTTGKGVNTNPTSKTRRGAEGPRTAPQQGPSQRVSGLQGSRTKSSKTSSPPRPASPRPARVGPQTRQAKAVQAANPGRAARAARRGGRGGPTKGMLAAGLVSAAATGRLRNPISKAKAQSSRKEGQKATLNGKPVVWSKRKMDWVPDPGRNAGNYNTRDADGTVRNRKKVGPKKVGAKKVGTIAQAFDKAYAAAKKAGKKTFTFNGKSYSTK